MAHSRIDPWASRGKWVEASTRLEIRAVPSRWGAVQSIVLILVDQRPDGCPRRRWHRLQRAQRMGRLA